MVHLRAAEFLVRAARRARITPEAVSKAWLSMRGGHVTGVGNYPIEGYLQSVVQGLRFRVGHSGTLRMQRALQRLKERIVSECPGIRVHEAKVVDRSKRPRERPGARFLILFSTKVKEVARGQVKSARALIK